MANLEVVERFSKADSAEDVWSSARQLMANRLLAEFVDVPIFLKGFDRLYQFATAGTALDRLLALDLLVRLPAATKKLTSRAEKHLRATLKDEIPPLSILNDSSYLPEQAKPADIRENIAIGLSYAQGEWVRNYLLTSIVNEQQSQRTRDVLLKELVTRTDTLGGLIHDLIHAFDRYTDSAKDKNNPYLNLTSICLSLTNIISQDRQIIEIDVSSPTTLDLFARSMIKYSGKHPLPPKLEDVAIAVVRLLDEILIAEISMFVEPNSYLAIERISRWWNFRSFPSPLQLAMQPIVSKLVGAIGIRAKMGQKPQELLTCLRHAVQDPQQFIRIRNELAESANLAPDIDDWLRGKERRSVGRTRAWRRALKSAGQEETDQLIAGLLIYSSNLRQALEEGNDEEAKSAAIGIASRVRSAALARRLKMEGTVGTIVDYSITAHETPNAETPVGQMVRLETPMVVRTREDGTRDVVFKAVVTEVRNG